MNWNKLTSVMLLSIIGICKVNDCMWRLLSTLKSNDTGRSGLETLFGDVPVRLMNACVKCDYWNLYIMQCYGFGRWTEMNDLRKSALNIGEVNKGDIIEWPL